MVWPKVLDGLMQPRRLSKRPAATSCCEDALYPNSLKLKRTFSSLSLPTETAIFTLSSPQEMDGVRRVITMQGDLNIPAIITLIIAISVVYYLITTIYSWHRLRHIPGPLFASLTYTWFGFWMWRGRITQILGEIQRQYGPIVRVGPNVVLVSDPEILWYINGVRSNYSRGDWYASVRVDPSGHNIVCEPDTARHDARKAQITAAYAGKRRVINFEAVVDTQLEDLLHLLATKYAGANGKALDLSRIVRYFVVDVVTTVMLGKPWGNVANETDSFQFFGMMDSRLPFVHSIAVVPSLRSFFYSPFFLSLAGPKPTDKSGIGHFIGITKLDIERRLKIMNGTEAGPAITNRNVLDEWLKLGMTYDECQRETLLHIPAGSETTATTIIGTMFYLLSSPPVYRKLKNEIAKGILERRISSPITVNEAKALPYLQAVICEGFRLASAVNSGFSKRVPAGGDTIQGVFLPGGTEIMWNGFEMMRTKNIFGVDVDVFRPERFLECDEATKARQLKVIDLGFGHGRWMCPGKALAWVQLNKIYVELLRRFDFQILNPDKPKRSVAYQGSRIHDFWVKVTDDKLD